MLPEDTDYWYWLQLVLSIISDTEIYTRYGGNFLGPVGDI